mgnify:CR=1 FL=1
MDVATLKIESETAMITEKSELELQGKVIFEEYPLALASSKIPQSCVEVLQSLCADPVWRELPHKLALVSDELFAYFAEHACEVAQHIRIEDTTGVVAEGALFNQENVPSEALFYAVVQSRAGEGLKVLGDKLAQAKMIQLGADETTGLGWCTVKVN